VRHTASGARRFFAASSRWAREIRSGQACRVPRGRAFGRGFDSRRLHSTRPRSGRVECPERASWLRASRRAGAASLMAGHGP